MSSRIASRIVVAVALAVVFGVGVVSIFIVPAKPRAQNQIAHNAPPTAASTDQTVANSSAPSAAAPAQTAPDGSAAVPTAATAPVAPPAVASPTNANEDGAPNNDTNLPKPRNAGPHGAQARNHHDKEPSSSHGDDRSIRLASVDNVKKSSAPPNDSQNNLEAARSDGGITSASSPSATNDAVESSEASPPPPNVEVNPASEQSYDGSASDADMDGRLTAQVRSSIASVAPGNNIDVRAMSGIVALAGTVPSQSVVEGARQAAQQIAGVKQVDTSALTVSNQ